MQTTGSTSAYPTMADTCNHMCPESGAAVPARHKKAPAYITIRTVFWSRSPRNTGAAHNNESPRKKSQASKSSARAIVGQVTIDSCWETRGILPGTIWRPTVKLVKCVLHVRIAKAIMKASAIKLRVLLSGGAHV